MDAVGLDQSAWWNSQRLICDSGPFVQLDVLLNDPEKLEFASNITVVEVQQGGHRGRFKENLEDAVPDDHRPSHDFILSHQRIESMGKSSTLSRLRITAREKRVFPLLSTHGDLMFEWNPDEVFWPRTDVLCALGLVKGSDPSPIPTHVITSHLDGAPGVTFFRRRE
ncbi:uncharacterized protein ARMOST_17853 [Armillaria ostoyae]|uniref:Uncharacterized protein n=1 Tax=Armillaria ostoyae TaxID=47428 RepID=A0A284S093_ARMOS|nr:uncharacterized protein ARMOST_17853 [Armillaria ostoyae]